MNQHKHRHGPAEATVLRAAFGALALAVAATLLLLR